MIEAHCLWMRRRGLGRDTISRRRWYLEAIDARYGLATVTTEDIEVLLDARNLGPKARYGWISHLAQFYEWAIDFGLLTQDPTAKLARPKMKTYRPRPIATEDLYRAIREADQQMRCWLVLMAFGGLRCCGVARLHADDVIWEGSLLHLHEKNDKERLVPMHPFIATELRRHGVPKSGPVFTRERGGGYRPANVSRLTNAFLAELGIDATAHQLRHWFGTNVYRASKDLRVTQELMGHSSPTTTAVYADWSREAAREAVEALAIA